LPLLKVSSHLMDLPLHGTQVLLFFPQFSLKLILALQLLLQN
jgi:hypothetical protein